jgi:hypothetical protein
MDARHAGRYVQMDTATRKSRATRSPSMRRRTIFALLAIALAAPIGAARAQ